VFDGLRPKAILFDFYGTLVDIETDERSVESWRVLSSFLRYRGGRAEAEELRDAYMRVVQARLDGSREAHPDVDVVDVFGETIAAAGVDRPRELAGIVAQLFRSLTVRHLSIYERGLEALRTLSATFKLGLVSDSQEAYILPELRAVGLEGMFATVIISSRYGYRKPDPRVFHHALTELGVSGSEAIYVGNSWDRDVVGAAAAGIPAVWLPRRSDEPRGADVPGVVVIRDVVELLQLAGIEG
jgi:putative hydrolase of the HAD superfamily